MKKFKPDPNDPFDNLVEFLKKYPRPDTKNLHYERNAEKYIAAKEAIDVLTAIVKNQYKESEFEPIIDVHQDVLTGCDLDMSIEIPYLEIDKSVLPLFIDAMTVAEGFEVDANLNGNVVISFTFRAVYNLIYDDALEIELRKENERIKKENEKNKKKRK